MATAADQAIQQLTTELNNLTQSIRALLSATGRTANATEANAQLQRELNDELEDYEKQLVKNRKLTDDQQKLVKDAVATKKAELQATRDLSKASKEAAEALRKHGAGSALTTAANQRVQSASANLANAQQATAASAATVQGSFVGLVKGTKAAQAAVVWFGETLMAQANQMLAQQKANAGLIEGTDNLLAGLVAQQNQALRLGLSGQELAQTVAANRQLVNSIGDTAKTIDTLNPTIDRMRILTGSNAEALQIATDAARGFAEKGVRPTQASMLQYTNDLVQLGKQTGMNAADAHRFYDEMSSDADMIVTLRQARDGEREQILANQRAMVQHSIAMGMSATQAKEAAKMMQKMVAAKPLDRIRQAAKVRALGGALGIQGADEAAAGIMAGSRATDAQKQAMQRFNTNAANAVEGAAQQGLGAELAVTAIVDKLGLSEQFAPGGPFSTTMGDSLKPAVGAIEKLTDSSITAQGKLFGEVNRIAGQVDQILSGNHIAGLALSAIAASVSLIAGKMALSAGANAIGSIGRAVTGGGSMAARAASMGRLAAAGGVMVAGGAAIDAAAGAVGVGGNKIDEKQDDANWNRMSGGQKLESGLARGIEKLGGLVFLDNIANEAKANRIKSETGYLDKQGKSEAQDAITTSTQATANGIDTQVKQMDTQTTLLQAMKSATDRQVELSEKMLVAMTMTESERADKTRTNQLRKDNKFASQYNYL